MALDRSQIIRVKSGFWKSKIRKWRKNQMNRYMRRLPISDDDIGFKRGRKPIRSWEF